MSRRRETFTRLREEVGFQRIQGIEVELDYVLPPGWSFSVLLDRYQVEAPYTENWEDHAWRIIRLLTFHGFTALRREKHPGLVLYQLLSESESGAGFRLEIICKVP